MTSHTAVLREEVLSVKVKRLILLGASAAIRCEPCIRVHARGALEAGATREEILEAAGAVDASTGQGYSRHPPSVLLAWILQRWGLTVEPMVSAGLPEAKISSPFTRLPQSLPVPGRGREAAASTSRGAVSPSSSMRQPR